MKTTARSKRQKRRATIFAAASAAQFIVLCHAVGSTDSWTNSAGGDFNVTTNWSLGRVPKTTDAPVFNLSKTYSITLANYTGASVASIAFGNGTVTLTSGTLTSTGSLAIGSTAAQGATGIFTGVTLTAGSAVIGDPATSSGTMTFDTTFNVTNGLTIGNAGSGTLLASGNSTLSAGSLLIGNSAGSTGLFTLGDANNSAEAFFTAGLTVGNSGNGTLSLLNGSEIGDATTLKVASAAGSAGTLLVAGGSVVNLNGAITVGNSASATAKGNILLSGGGQLNDAAAAMTIYAGGSVSINNGILSVASIDDSHGGTFTFLSGSLLLNSSDLGIGSAGIAGAPTEGLLGKNLSVGTTSLISVSGTTTIASDGTLTINGGDFDTGGFVNNGNFSFVSGAFGITNQNVIVDQAAGLFTTLNLSNKSFSVGQTLTIGEGSIGLVTVPDGGFLNANELVIGDAATGKGTLLIQNTSAGTAGASVGDTVTVGNSGSGTLIVTNGSVTVNNISIAAQAGSSGTVTIGGTGNVAINGQIAIGGVANGDGTTSPAGGTVAALLKISDTATLAGPSGSTISIYPGGSLVLAGGTLSVDSIDNSKNGTFTYTGGTLDLNNSNLNIGNNNAGAPTEGLLGKTVEITSADTVAISGTTTIATDGALTIDSGGSLTSGVVSNKNSLIVASGGALRSTSFTTASASTTRVDGTLSLGASTAIVSGAKLFGGGKITGSTLTLNSGAIVSAGAAGSGPAKLTSSAQKWNGGATDQVDIATATATAGVGYDELSLSSLAVTATSSTPFIVQLVSLGGNVQGQAVAGFNRNQNYAFTIAQVNADGSGNASGTAFTVNGLTPNAGALTGSTSSVFAIDAASFDTANAIPAGARFELDLVSASSRESDLVLNYIAAPEPATMGVVMGSLSLLMRRRRRGIA